MKTKPLLKKVLFVDDEEDICTIVQIVLAELGQLEVKTALCGKEALSEAENFKPDLLLLDVMMPEMSGPETLAKLRKLPHLKKTPVIFMTAKIQDAEVAEYLALGAIDVIAKPFEPMQLLAKIQASFKNA